MSLLFERTKCYYTTLFYTFQKYFRIIVKILVKTAYQPVIYFVHVTFLNSLVVGGVWTIRQVLSLSCAWEDKAVHVGMHMRTHTHTIT